MWCRSICSRLTVLGSTLLAACSLAGSAAYAQRRDEAWVIAQIMSGKLDDLRALEKLSDESVPFAMYWWGTLLHHCVFEICDRAAAQALFFARRRRVTPAPRRLSSPSPPRRGSSPS